MAENFQRRGSASNSNEGKRFERLAMATLAERDISVVKNFSVNVGVHRKKKPHSFDLGSEEPPILVECKSHKWTSSGNVPHAKMADWNEAMYYFNCSPRKYRKIFFVRLHERPKGKRKETLAHYYIRTYQHLIPKDVEIWEYDESHQSCEIVYYKTETKLKRLSQTAEIHDITSPIDAQWDAMK